jgi:hypothetical protein
VLDNVRTGVDWVLWPGGDRRDDLHHLVVDAMMPAAHARAVHGYAQENPQTWQEQYGEPLALWPGLRARPSESVHRRAVEDASTRTICRVFGVLTPRGRSDPGMLYGLSSGGVRLVIVAG